MTNRVRVVSFISLVIGAFLVAEGLTWAADKAWQAAQTDGELFWILRNGSKGTAMASFIPLVLTEEEAWQVLRYVRSFGQP